MKTTPAPLFIEPLEARIAPAAVFTYTDVDGDLVTIKTSKGTNADLTAILTLAPTGLGLELQRIDFSAAPLGAGGMSIFHGTNLAVSAKRTTAGGDGLVNVGYIDASTAGGGTALDLGRIAIRGDLGQIDAGDATTATTAVAGVSVWSMGQFGTTTQAVGGSLTSNINGPLGFLNVAGNVKDAYLNVEGGVDGVDGRIGSVVIRGSLIGGDGTNSGRVFGSGRVGAVSIVGNVEGGGGLSSGSIGSDISIARVTVVGSIIGGAHPSAGSIYGSIAVGRVKIGGNIAGGTDFDAGSVASGGSLASVSVGGSVFGGSAAGTGQITSDGAMGPVTIRGSLVGGSGSSSGSIHSDGTMGPATIGGNIQGGSGDGSGAISSTFALARVTVGGSLLGGPATHSGQIYCSNPMGPVRIGGNIEGGDVDAAVALFETGFVGGQRIASVYVGGSIIAGTASGGGTLSKSGAVGAFDDLGPITIKGSLIGNSTTPVLIIARGQAAPGATTDVAIKSLTVGGRVEHADILAGYFHGGGAPMAVNADAQIGRVIAGDWIASNLVAGVQDNVDPARNDFFGEGDDQAIAGGSDRIVSRIASVVIRGAAYGTVGVADFFGIVAQQIGSFKVGQTAFPLTAGAANDLAGLFVGAIGDLRVREVTL